MGDVLAELERVLRADPRETITLEEELVLQKCKTRAVNTFLLGVGISSALVWGATKRRFSTVSRASFSVGAGLFVGGWTFDRSLSYSVQRILAAHGTRMQREVSRIIMSKNLRNPESPVSRIFFPERVYEDSSRDKAQVRWRTRNFYQEDPMIDSQEDALTPRNLSPSGSVAAGRSWKEETEKVAGLGDLIADPLDYILGYPELGEMAVQQNTSHVISRRNNPSQRRRQRRNLNRYNRNASLVESPKAISPDQVRLSMF
ncbi:uncharacterized protein LOC144713423 [Wolffia australiana]